MPPHLTLCLAGGPGRSQHILQIPIPQGHPGFRHYGEPELEKSTSLKAWFLTLFITHRNVHDDRSGKAGSSRTCGGAETHPQTGVREEAEDGRRGPAARVAQGFGENGVRGGETTGSEKASGVCVASAQFRGATAPDLSGTPVDKGKERRSTGYASCGVQPQRCAGASGRHRQVGAEEREPESRGGHGQLRASPAGHPSEAGKGETRSVGWDTSVHSGVSWGGGVARSRKLDAQTVQRAVPWRCCGAPATAARVGAGLRRPGTLTGWHLRIWARGCVLHLLEARVPRAR